MFEAKQDDIFERRQAGTGEWFLQSNEFQNWLLGSLNCLWCTASRKLYLDIKISNIKSDFWPPKAGAGKTTMA
jgi:hypothetical protein